MVEVMPKENIIDHNDKFCKRCHRKLKDETSKRLGFGKICYNKYINSKKKYLFEIEESKNER